MGAKVSVLIGPAGSGKTRTLATWCDRAVARFGADKVLVCSLTRTGARNAARDIELPLQQFGTVHSFAYRALGSPELAESRLAEWNTAYPHFALSGAKHATKTPDDGYEMPDDATSGDVLKLEYSRLRTTQHAARWTDAEVIAFGQAWEDWKQQTHTMDFNDLIERALTDCDTAPGDPAVMFGDEWQDSGRSENALMQKWAAKAQHIVYAGDFAQCHPPGTYITTHKGVVSIEQLDPTQHKLLSFDRRGSEVRGFDSGYAFTMSSRHVETALVSIVLADGTQIRCTQEHRWPVRWAKDTDLNVVYLQRKGVQWRVGWCQLFNGYNGSFHAGYRASMEDADAMWILSVHDTKARASLTESLVATRYGLPTITFTHLDKYSGDTKSLYTEEGIAWFFSQLDVQEQHARATQCLLDHNRHPALPLWSAHERAAKQGKRTPFNVHAANFIPEAMQLAQRANHKTIVWVPFRCTREAYSGLVYSLDVPPHHLYFANNVLTHNSIFSWRGTDALLLQHLWQEHDKDRAPLKQSYRLSQAVYGVAWDWISRFEQTMKVPYEPITEDIARLQRRSREGSVWRGASPFATMTPQSIDQLVQPYLAEGKTVMFLATCGYMLEPITKGLREAGTPFHNPFRTNNGKWNPLPQQRTKGHTVIDRVLLFARPRADVWGDQARFWTAGEMKAWVSGLPATHILKRGGQKALQELRDDATDEAIALAFRHWFLPEVLPYLVPEPNLTWYLEKVKGSDNLRDFVDTIIQRHGPQKLREKPLVTVGTVHALKGAESDVVIMCPDLSPQAYESATRSIEAAEELRRVMYVGVTRARDTLVLCEPGTRMSVRW